MLCWLGYLCVGSFLSGWYWEDIKTGADAGTNVLVLTLLFILLWPMLGLIDLGFKLRKKLMPTQTEPEGKG